MPSGLKWQPVVAIIRDVAELEGGPSRRTVGARTGGRSERVVRKVLEATIDELARVGYVALRMDDVAARAGVAKTTVYRRWPTKPELVEAAIRDAARFHDPLPDTGDVRGDLVALVQATVGRLGTPSARAIARLVATESDPEIARLAKKLRDDKRRSHAEVVVRAQARGELPKDVDPTLLVEVAFAPIVTRVMRSAEQPPLEEIERVVDLVVTGAENGGGVRRRRAGRRGA